MAEVEPPGSTLEEFEESTPSIPEMEASEPIPEIIDTPFDPKFFNAEFKIRKVKVRLLETETYRKETGDLKPGEQVIVTVQAVTSSQYFKAQEEKDLGDLWKKLGNVFLEKPQNVVPAALQEAMEKAELATHKEVVFRIELILMGARTPSGAPLFRRSQVVNLAEFFTQDFLRLSNAVLDLRGEGPNAGEGQPSFGKARS